MEFTIFDTWPVLNFKLAHYPVEAQFAFLLLIGFNLPDGVLTGFIPVESYLPHLFNNGVVLRTNFFSVQFTGNFYRNQLERINNLNTANRKYKHRR